MWNFSSQEKQPSVKPKYFVALANLLSLLGGLLRDGGNGEGSINQGFLTGDFASVSFVLNNCHSEVFSQL